MRYYAMNLLITFLSAHRDTFGGMERSIFSLIKGLTANGCNVYVYTSEPDEGVQNFFYSPYLTVAYPQNQNMIDSAILRHYEDNKEYITLELSDLLIKYNIDYILVIDQLWGIIPHLNILGNLQCPVGLVYHMFLQQDLIKRTLEMPFTHYFAVSEDVKYKINTINALKKPVYLLPNSYCEDEFSPREILRQNYDIFCNTRLAQGKGIEYLLEAFLMIHNEYPKYNLSLCGGEFHFGERNYVLKQIKDYISRYPSISSHIKINEKIPWKLIPQYILNSRMVILPTSYESFGIAALEAIACEVPLIATNVGNLPQLIQNAGIIVEFGNPEDIYRAVKIITENSNKVAQLKENCRLVKSAYEAKRVAKNFIECIRP